MHLSEGQKAKTPKGQPQREARPPSGDGRACRRAAAVNGRASGPAVGLDVTGDQFTFFHRRRVADLAMCVRFTRDHEGLVRSRVPGTRRSGASNARCCTRPALTRNPQPGAFPDLPRRRLDVARMAAGLPSRRKAAPLCMARCGVLSLSIRYCGASGEARTV